MYVNFIILFDYKTFFKSSVSHNSIRQLFKDWILSGLFYPTTQTFSGMKISYYRTHHSHLFVVLVMEWIGRSPEVIVVPLQSLWTMHDFSHSSRPSFLHTLASSFSSLLTTKKISFWLAESPNFFHSSKATKSRRWIYHVNSKSLFPAPLEEAFAILN